MKSMDRNGFSDPYVVFVAPWVDGEPKTEFVRKTLDPVWDDQMVPNILSTVSRIEYLEKSHLWFKVVDHDDASHDDEMGQALLSLGDVVRSEKPVEFELKVFSLGKQWGTISGSIHFVQGANSKAKPIRRKSTRK
jgi:Ca2+-dependent lipid-binding protein